MIKIAQEKIFKFLNENKEGHYSNKELEIKLNISPSSASNGTKKLFGFGLINKTSEVRVFPRNKKEVSLFFAL